MNEPLLCRFVAAMAQEGLSPGTTRTYLAGVRHAQIIRGLPEPKEGNSLARLRLVYRQVSHGIGRTAACQQLTNASQ